MLFIFLVLLYSVTSAAGAGVVVVGAGKLASALFGAQDSPLSTLNVPPVAVVLTHTGYLLRVRIAHAVTCAQHLFVSGYTVVVSPPIDTATGIPIVAVVGIACATTIQYLHPLRYEPAGIFTTSVSTPFTVTTVTDVLMIKFGQSRLQFLLQLIFFILLKIKIRV